MMIQDIPHGRYWKPKPAPKKIRPPVSWTKKNKEVAPRNPSTQRNPSLPEDDQIMHFKIGPHLVKIHLFDVKGVESIVYEI